MADIVQAVSDDKFQAEVLDGDKPTLVDFWAAWCAPCRAIAPVVEDLAKSYEGKVNVRKINIDENPSTPMKYGVKGIPTLMLFDKGEVVDQVVGAVSKDRLEEILKKVA